MGKPKPKIALLIAVLFSSQVLMSASQNTSEIYLRDNSDWWSVLRKPDSQEVVSSQKGEPSASNFEILGIKLNSESLFTQATAKLGEAQVINRGDASAGRSQICYQSASGSDNIHLIFERGEVTDSFYLFVGGPDWKASDLCARSGLITGGLSLASGIQLGQTPARLKTVLGNPNAVRGNKYIWSFGVEKKSTAKDLERVRRQRPELSDEDLHRDYDFFELSVNIRAKFSDSKLTYLVVSRAAAY